MEEEKALPEFFHKVHGKLQENFSQALIETKYSFNEFTIKIKHEFLIPVMQYLKEELKLNYLTDLTAVDYPEREKRFEVVYHLFSLENHNRLRVKVEVRDGEKISSLTRIWGTANWLEREVYDMFGLEFEGHPELKRILLSEEWEGHPLRKDYPLIGDGKQPY